MQPPPLLGELTDPGPKLGATALGASAELNLQLSALAWIDCYLAEGAHLRAFNHRSSSNSSEVKARVFASGLF